MVHLSRSDIEKIAEPIIQKYKQFYVPERHLFYNVDPLELAALLGYSVVYANITKTGSILGQTSSCPIWTTILDDSMNEIFFFLDGKTILIEKRLLQPNLIGRKNFTIAHELAHLILNQHFSESSESTNQILCDYRRSEQPKKKITDWYEWQADAMAAALLLPRAAVEEGMFWFGLGDRMKVLSKKYSEYKYDRFCELADFLQVSKTTLSYRMEQLGLLERNYLIQEAQARKGVA